MYKEMHTRTWDAYMEVDDRATQEQLPSPIKALTENT